MKHETALPAPNRRSVLRVLSVGTSGLLWGCGGAWDDGDEDGDDGEDTNQPLYQAFNDLRGGMSPAQVRRAVRLDLVGSPSANSLEWDTDRERLEVSFRSEAIASARWTLQQTSRSYLRTFRVTGDAAAVRTGTLYRAFLALRPGMTRAQVIRRVPVSVSEGEGAGSRQVFWVWEQEVLSVRFNGGTDRSTLNFAQWGITLSTGAREESRTY